jgi:hypothetical protein
VLAGWITGDERTAAPIVMEGCEDCEGYETQVTLL